ncbi:MAG: SPFH domain-containing protein [Atopobium sp.]|nr:SPFH domain-containing protein [Atopobium sp.]
MSTEKIIKSKSGWLFLLITIVLFAVAALFTLNFVLSAIAADRNPRLDPSFPSIIGALVFFFAGLFVSSGLFSLQPGQAKVCVLFGKYIGTVKDEGLRWANPYYAKTLSTNVGDLSSLASGTGVPTVNVHTSIISTRARTLNGEVLKVNDRMGNPIEIAEVVVWRVSDTAKALFDVDDYDSYVTMQAETALRHVASIYSYDHMEDESESNTAITLRSNIEEVSEALQSELSRNLSVAGITVDDARLTHLSYAPEIAQAMLRRQQAEAIIAARKKIVEGAVSMVDMALTQLSENGVVEFDEDRKAVMASNLMVVLCGESEAQPVLNTGSLQQ